MSVAMKVKSEREVAQSCLTLSDPMDCSLPGSSVQEIFQARVLEWGAIAFSVLCLSVQFSSVAQSCSTLCDSVNHSMPGLPVHHQLLEFTQIHIHRVSDAISHLILCSPLLLPPIPPSITVFSSESALRMRWPQYWSFSLSMVPSVSLCFGWFLDL